MLVVYIFILVAKIIGCYNSAVKSGKTISLYWFYDSINLLAYEKENSKKQTA